MGSKDISPTVYGQILSTAFSTVPIGMIIVAPDATIAEVNGAFCRLVGFSREELIGASILALGLINSPELADQIREAVERTGFFEKAEIRLRSKDGTEREVRFSIESIPAEGEMWTFSVVLDIAERKRVEKRAELLRQALAVSREVNQALMRLQDRPAIFEIVCRAAVEKGGFSLAWIGLLNDETGEIESAAEMGDTARRVSMARAIVHDGTHSYCPVERALATGNHMVCPLIASGTDAAPCQQEAFAAGLRSCASFPLRWEGQVHGTLTLYSEIPDAFEDMQLALLEEIAGDIGFGMQLLNEEREREAAEAARRVSQKRYRDLVDMSPDAIFINRKNHLVYANPAALRLFGAESFDKLQGKSIFELFDPHDHEIIRERLRLMEDGRVVPLLREKVIRFDGTYRDVEVAAAPFSDEEGFAVQVVLRDITEQVKAEARLRESETRLRKAQTIAHVGNWELDLATWTMTGSEESLRVYGLPLHTDTFPLVDVQSCVLPEYRARLNEALRALIEHGTVYNEDFRIRRVEDGAIRAVRSRAERVLDESGRPTKVLGVIQDVTGQRRVEEALRESEERFKAILYSIGNGVISTDIAGRVTHMNRAAESMTGWPEAAAREVAIADVFMLSEGKDLPPLADDAVHAAAEGRVVTLSPRALLASRDGTSRPVSCSIAPILSARGKITGVVITFDDESREQSLEAQFRQAQKLEAVARLAGGVAHDYNNMTAVIQGYAQLLEKKLPAEDPLRGYVREIADAARRSASLTRQLLAFARKQVATPVPLDLNAQISALEKMLVRLIGEDITLDLRLAEELWIVRLDPTQADQILANLCTNARDAIKDTGTITIETANTVLDAAFGQDHIALPGEYVQLTFHDTGKGMDEETRSRVFEPFFTTKPVGEGTGLGLATVFGIVSQNGGFIDMASEPWKGTTFHIYLPRDRGEAASPQASQPADIRHGSETVLLVEDEAQLLGLAQSILEDGGYTVIAARTPLEAIELCRTADRRIDLLVTDVVMPGMNGRELQQRIGQIRPDMKTLFMSGYSGDAISTRGILDEGLNFLPKPFTPRDLTDKVRRVLDSETGS